MGPKASPAKVTKDGKTKRQPSAYNNFMKVEIAKVKAADSELNHKDAFKKAAGNWKTAKVMLYMNNFLFALIV